MAASETPPGGAERAVDIAVVGGGPTGMLAALAAATAGWTTTLVAPEPGHDPRTSAVMMPALETLEALGVWEAA